MKKLLATTTGLISSVALSPQAFAVNLNPCPGDGANFGKLCEKNASQLGPVLGNILTAILVVAVVVALLFLIWGGFKWMTAGGNEEMVSGARTTIIAGIVGLAIIIGSFAISRFVVENLSSSTGGSLAF